MEGNWSPKAFFASKPMNVIFEFTYYLLLLNIAISICLCSKENWYLVVSAHKSMYTYAASHLVLFAVSHAAQSDYYGCIIMRHLFLHFSLVITMHKVQRWQNIRTSMNDEKSFWTFLLMSRNLYGWLLLFSAGVEGKEGNSLPSTFRCEDSGAEDRIAHILSEANQALQQQRGNHNSMNNNIGNQDSFCDESGGSKSPLSINNNNGCNNNGGCPSSPLGSSSSARERERRMRKYENDDIPQEQVARIYQEELAKLVGIRLPHSLGGGDDPRIPREHFQRSVKSISLVVVVGWFDEILRNWD
jgi:hypothetical protein